MLNLITSLIPPSQPKAQIPKFQGQIQGIFTCHSHIPGQLPSSAHSYIFTCHLHPPRPVSCFLRSIVFCMPSVAHSDPQAQILKFLSRCWKINYRRCIPWDNKTVPHIPAFRASSSSQTIEKRNHKRKIYPAERKLPLTYTKSSSARKVQHTRPFKTSTYPVLKTYSPTSFLQFSSPGCRKSAKEKKTLKKKSKN